MRTSAFFRLIVGLLMGFVAPTAVAVNVSWTGGGDGVNWHTGANWSGGVVPPAGSDVTISVPASNPTILFTSSAGTVQINSLTSSELMTISGGTLQVATTLQISQDTTLSGGTIKGGTVTTTGGAKLVFTSSGGTLDGVTLNGSLDLSLASATVIVKNAVLNGVATIGGTLQISGTFLSSQNIFLSGGTIKNGAVTTTGGASLVLPQGGRGTLDGVTLGTDLTVPDAAILTVRNGLTLNNAKLILAAGGNWAFVHFNGTQTLGGAGEVVFTGISGQNYLYAQGGNNTPAAAAVLTLGPGITVHGSKGGYLQGYYQYDSIVNQGTINADTGGMTLTVSGAAVTNTGSIGASNGGTLNVNGAWTNAGTMNFSNGGVLGIGGVLDNTDKTLTLNASSGAITLAAGGTIKGGTLVASLTGVPPPFVAGQLASAVQFDGSTNYADFGNPADHHLDLGTNATIETWVRFSSLPGSGSFATFVSKDAGSGSQNKWIFGYDRGYAGANALVFHINTSGSGSGWIHSSAWTPVVGQWYHVAITKTGASYAFYINGVAAGTATSTVTVPTVSANLEMARAEGTFRFSGSLDDMRMWNVARTVTDIANTRNQELVGDEAGLVGYWKFNEAGGTSLADSTANGVSGAFNGSVPSLFSASNITLDGVTLGSDLAIPSGGTLNVKNGLTLNNARLNLQGGGSFSTVTFQGTQSLGGTGEVVFGGTTSNNRVYVQGGNTAGTAATLSIGSGIVVRGSQGGSLQGFYGSYDGFSNDGRISADTSGKTISISGAGLADQGRIGAGNGGTLTLSAATAINATGIVSNSSSGNITAAKNLLGSTTTVAASTLQGKATFNGSGTSVTPQLLEAMSNDLGNVTAGFTNNFVFGTLALGNNTYVKLVDQSDNATGSGAEAVYANSIIVPAGCTLNLDGLNVYARGVQVSGTVLNGTISQIPDSGPLALGSPAPGNVSLAGELDEWTFFATGGKLMSILVNPGTTGSPAPVSPQLLWANVQLLDASNNVLASNANPTSGALVTLSNVVLPASGTYKIRINASASHTASTGNYILSAWDVTPTVRSLNLGQQGAGNIATPFALDQWNFSAAAGQQIQFDLIASSSSGVAFKLTGPGNSTLFQDITGDSALINLPSSGNYTLSAYGLNGATGSYSFVMKQTSVTNLPPSTTYNGTWVGSGQAQLFSVPVSAANPLSVVLTDANASNHTELYVRFGTPPTRTTYDLGNTGAGASHSLLVPLANTGTWYVLVYGESIPSSAGSFTLKATSTPVVLFGTSLRRSASNIDTTFTLSGAGFTAGSSVVMVGAGGAEFAATSSSTDSPTQITAIFAQGTLPGGEYSLKITQPDGSSSILSQTIRIEQVGQGILTTNIEVPGVLARRGTATLYVNYANTGNAPMPAPLLILDASNSRGHGAYLTLNAALQTSGFWTSATPEGYSSSIQILANGASPGVLQPGESFRVPVYYAGWVNAMWDFGDPRLNFSLTTIKPDDATPVDWASRESSMKPSSISAEAWHVMYAGLLAQLGGTAGGFVQLLDNQAIYLARLGQNVTDVNKLWAFAVAQAQAVWPMPTLGGTVDDSLPTPGALSLSFGRAFNQTIPGRFRTGPLGLGWFTPWQQRLSVAGDGTVTLESGSGGNAIYQPDSRYLGRYFSQPGDHNIFTAGGGGYQLTAPNGRITAFHSNGSLSYLEDTNGNRITAGYAGSRLTTLTSSSGKSLTLAYNGAGLISTLTDSLGRVTTYNYNAASQHLLSVTSFTGRVTSYAYNTTAASPALNALTTITFPDNTHQYFTHDSAGRIASTYADGNTLTKTFTYARGQVSTSDALNHSISLFFDHNGQLARTVDALGNPTIYNYDESFNLARVTNATGASAAYAYDETGKVTLATDFLGHTTNLTYGGPQHQLTALTDANGNTTLYGYDGKGNMRSTTSANSRSEQFTYDPLGNALSFVNAAGSLTQYGYNAAGQLTSATFSDGSSFAYAYDAEGHLSTATDATGITTFTYDPVTRLLTKVEYPNGKWLSFGYDAGGRRTSMVDQGGFTTSYAYDAVGRLESLRDGSNQLVVSYHYDAVGRLDRKDNGNGTYSTYAYDANGNVLHLINYAPNGSINSRFDDTYNSLGLKTSEATLDGVWNYTYDATGQLVHSIFASNNTASVPNQDLAYNYDAMGNRTSTVINGVTTAYVPNNMNQYTSVGGTAQSYDANGNLTADGTNTFVYNTLNKLVSTTGPSGTTTYTYNALGQRVASTAAGQATQYLTDPAGLGNVVSTYNGSGTLISHFTHGLGLVNQTSAATFFYDFDPLGSTAGMSNSAGSYANRYSYVPFGGSLSSSVTVPNVFQFVGKWGVMFETADISSMRVRMASLQLGRFLSIDPKNLWGGDANLYRYVRNSVTGFSDPKGTDSWLDKYGEELQAHYDSMNDLADMAKRNATPNQMAEHVSEHGEKMQQAALEGLGEYAATMLADALSSPSQIFTELGGVRGAILSGARELWDNGKTIFDNSSFRRPHASADGLSNDQFQGLLRAISSAVAGATVTGVTAVDPNALYGPAGYGSANFMPGSNVHFPYRIEFENDADASAPAQTVNITDNLSASLDWSTFQLTGVGFGDVNLTIPAGSQHFQKTVSMTQNGQTFEVQIEVGIHSGTGQVYAIFQSIMPGTGLPPSNPLTGFLPPEDGTGRGQGFLTYTIAPKTSNTTGTQITNVANIVFDAGFSISTDQIDPHDASKGTDPAKRALVTIDAEAPIAQMNALPAFVPASFAVSWSGSDVGSGIASYTVYVSANGGDYTPWLTDTTEISATYNGVNNTNYSFYVVAKDNVKNVQQVAAGAGAVSTLAINNGTISVEHPSGTTLTSGSSTISFGTTAIGTSSQRVFTVMNTVVGRLTLNTITIDGVNASDFAVTSAPDSPVLPGGSAFTVTFTPSAVGSRSAVLHIPSNDIDHTPFDIGIQGTGDTFGGNLAFAPVGYPVTEGGKATLTINRTMGSSGVVTVKIATNHLSASPATTATVIKDYIANTQTLSFGNGVTSQTFEVQTTTDTLVEANETFLVTLSTPTGGAVLGSGATARVTIIDPSALTTDVTAPALTLTKPAANALVGVNTGGTTNLSGTATDAKGVEKVEYRVVTAGGTPSAFTLATLGTPGGTSTMFTAPVTPVTGINTVEVKATDYKGNTKSLTRIFKVTRPLQVILAGTGTVTTGYAGTSFREVGKPITITAIPGKDQVFDGWLVNNTTGTGITPLMQEFSKLTFTFTEGLVLTAKFILNPFTPALVGSFNGLVLPDGSTTPGVANVGLLNILLGTKGSFTGSLKIDGTSLSTPGFFDNAGVARFGTTRARSLMLKRTGKPDLIVSLQLDMSGVSGRITGSVTQKLLGVVKAVSNVVADRAHYSTASALTKVPAALAGTTTKPYTLVFPSKTQTPALGQNTYPQGAGYATMTVNVNGTVSITGKLADHTPITASAPMSKNNQWPIFAQLYATKGSFAGLATLTDADAATEDVTAADLLWFRPFQNVQWYKNGWPAGITVDLFGARYVVPPALPATSVFPGLSSNSPNATLSFTDGLLADSISQDITISTANLIVSTSPTLVITKASGLISGTFTHSDLTKPAYQGVIVQKGANKGGHGYFMSRATPLNFLGESGRVQVLAK